MKKQYLICLLSIITMFGFLGTTPLTKNIKQKTFISSTPNTGLIILAQSKVMFYNETEDSLGYNDPLAAVLFNLQYNQEYNNGKYRATLDSNFHIYHSSSNELFSPTVRQIKDLGLPIDGNLPTYSLNINYIDDPDLNIWNYTYEASNKFSVYLDVTSENYEGEKPMKIGCVPIDENPVTYFPSQITTSNEVVITSNTSASIDYEVILGKDKKNNDFILDKIEWKNGDDVLATSNESSGTLETNKLEPKQKYRNTYLVATMQGGVKTKKIQIEEFSTKPINNHAIVISASSLFLFLFLSIIIILLILKRKFYRTVSS